MNRTGAPRLTGPRFSEAAPWSAASICLARSLSITRKLANERSSRYRGETRPLDRAEAVGVGGERADRRQELQRERPALVGSGRRPWAVESCRSITTFLSAGQRLLREKRRVRRPTPAPMYTTYRATSPTHPRTASGQATNQSEATVAVSQARCALNQGPLSARPGRDERRAVPGKCPLLHKIGRDRCRARHIKRRPLDRRDSEVAAGRRFRADGRGRCRRGSAQAGGDTANTGGAGLLTAADAPGEGPGTAGDVEGGALAPGAGGVTFRSDGPAPAARSRIVWYRAAAFRYDPR